MTNFRIPSRFNLNGQTIDIVFDHSIEFRNDNRGEAQYRENRIALAPPTVEYPKPLSQVEQTFFHELVHYITTYAGVEVSERDTDLMGHLLHQAFVTMEYND